MLALDDITARIENYKPKHDGKGKNKLNDDDDDAAVVAVRVICFVCRSSRHLRCQTNSEMGGGGIRLLEC